MIPNSLEQEPALSRFRAEHIQVAKTILRLAQWEGGGFFYGSQWIDVPRGCLAHSIKQIAAEARATPKVVRGVVDRLLARGWLEMLLGQRTCRGRVEQNANSGTSPGTQEGTGLRVLRICNYETYMGGVGREGTVPGTQEGNARAQRGHSEGTIQYAEHLADGGEGPPAAAPATATDDARTAVEYLEERRKDPLSAAARKEAARIAEKRLREGVTLDALKAALRGAATDQWVTDRKMHHDPRHVWKSALAVEEYEAKAPAPPKPLDPHFARIREKLRARREAKEATPAGQPPPLEALNALKSAGLDIEALAPSMEAPAETPVPEPGTGSVGAPPADDGHTPAMTEAAAPQEELALAVEMAPDASGESETVAEAAVEESPAAPEPGPVVAEDAVEPAAETEHGGVVISEALKSDPELAAAWAKWKQLRLGISGSASEELAGDAAAADVLAEAEATRQPTVETKGEQLDMGLAKTTESPEPNLDDGLAACTLRVEPDSEVACARVNEKLAEMERMLSPQQAAA